MQHILSRQIIRGKYLKWIFILQEFDLEFVSSKSKKSLTFTELMFKLPRVDEEPMVNNSFPNDLLFLIDSSDPWYGDIFVYLQNKCFCRQPSRDKHRCIIHHNKHYLIVYNTLYHQWVDLILCRCLIHEEDEHIFNDFHAKACGVHLSGLATSQKPLRVGYFWQSILKDCMNVVQWCNYYHISSRNMGAHPSPLHPMVTVDPFAKWDIDFITCRPTSANGHGYIIMAVYYFTKWDEAMPAYSNDNTTTALFIFNQFIAMFGLPKTIMTNHRSHFQSKMMTEVSFKLVFHHENSTPYYPQVNGQVNDINSVLKKMIQRMLGKHKTKWHLMLFSTLWAYWTSTKTVAGFTPFHIFYSLEVVLPIECEISSLKISI